MRRLAFLLLLLLALAVTVQAAPKPPTLALEAVEVDPAAPGPDTLCKLSVTVKSSGEKTASALGFRVRVDGKELPVYRNELYFRPVAPGAVAEIRLHNFWSSETGRPFPSGGRMTVEVTLTEARWMDVKTQEGTEIWTPVGVVAGLPVTKSVTLSPKKAR
jgi:hypothetical protein